MNISNLEARTQRRLVRDRMTREEEKKRLRMEDVVVQSILQIDNDDHIDKRNKIKWL